MLSIFKHLKNHIRLKKCYKIFLIVIWLINPDAYKFSQLIPQSFYGWALATGYPIFKKENLCLQISAYKKLYFLD